MCGRFLVISTKKKLEKVFNAKFEDSTFPPRYNAAPSQYLPIITGEKPKKIQLYKWGLLPHWAKDEKIAHKLINARAESVNQKPAFKQYFESQRCIIIADGFFEWKKSRSGKTPHLIKMKNNEPFAFAGIWSEWAGEKAQSQMNFNDDTETLYTFSIITTPPNALTRRIHDRMPAILHKGDYEKWIDKGTDPEKAHKLLKPYPASEMQEYEISTKVNNPKHNTSEILEPIK